MIKQMFVDFSYWIKDFWERLWERENRVPNNTQSNHNEEVRLELGKHNFIGTSLLQGGLIIWELDTSDKDVNTALRRAEVKVTTEMKQFGRARKEEEVKKYNVVVKPNCIYVQAINKKTAARKFMRYGIPKEKKSLYQLKKFSKSK